MKKTTYLILVLAAIIVVGVGFGASRGWQQFIAAPSPSPIESPVTTPIPELPQPRAACDVIAKDTVSQVVGQAMLDPKQSEVRIAQEMYHQGCLFLAESGAFTPTVQIDLMYQHLDDITAIESWWESQAASHSALPRYVALDGVGQSAYFNGHSLFIFQPPYVIRVVVSMTDPRVNREVAEALARAIISQWPQPL